MAINRDKKYKVKNRSASIVVYRIPEANIRRSWNPGEEKRISFNELEQLTFQPGGRELIMNFLQIEEEEITDDLGVIRVPEYDMSEQQVADLILNGSLDAFLDALDFAPIGVMDLIKKFSVSLPITDMEKRRALKEKTGFDVDKAIENAKADKEVESPKTGEAKAETTAAAPTGRRTTTNYKVVSQG